MRRVRQRDKELFPEPVFNWDRKRYGDELKHQMHLSELQKKLDRTKEIYLEKKILEENEQRYRLEQQEYEKNAEDLKNSILNMMNQPKMEPVYEEPMPEPIEEESYTDYDQQAALEEQQRALQRELELKRLREMNRPRTPINEAGDPILGRKVERELEKYRKYLEFQLPEEIKTQVTLMFEEEGRSLKDILRERDKLMHVQINSFHDYLRLLENDKQRELLNMKKLKEEMMMNKKLNNKRVLRIEEAIINTDNMLQDRYELEELTNIDLHEPHFYSSAKIGDYEHNPYKAATRRSYDPSNKLYASSYFKEDMKDFGKHGGNGFYQNVSMVNLKPKKKPQSAYIGRKGYTSDWDASKNQYKVFRQNDRKQRVDKILGELDDIMNDLNYPPDVESTLANARLDRSITIDDDF